MRKRLTVNQKALNKEIQRLRTGLNRAQRKGFFSNVTVEQYLDIPNRKKITRSFLNKVKKIKPRDIYKSGDFVIFDTGETIPAILALNNRITQENVYMRPSVDQTKQNKADIIIGQVYNYIDTAYAYSDGNRAFTKITFDEIVSRYLKYDLAQYIESIAESLYDVLAGMLQASRQEVLDVETANLYQLFTGKPIPVAEFQKYVNEWES